MTTNTKKKEIIKLIASSAHSFDKESIANLVDTTPEYVYEVALEAGLQRRLAGEANRGPKGLIQYPDAKDHDEVLQGQVEDSVFGMLERLLDLQKSKPGLDDEGKYIKDRQYINSLRAELSDSLRFQREDKWMKIALDLGLDYELEQLAAITTISQEFYDILTTTEED